MAPALLELVGDGNEAAANDVMLFLRAALDTFPDLSPSIYQVINQIMEALFTIKYMHAEY